MKPQLPVAKSHQQSRMEALTTIHKGIGILRVHLPHSGDMGHDLLMMGAMLELQCLAQRLICLEAGYASRHQATMT